MSCVLPEDVLGAILSERLQVWHVLCFGVRRVGGTERGQLEGVLGCQRLGEDADAISWQSAGACLS